MSYREDVEAARRSLADGVTRIPPAINSASVQTVRDFKACITRCKRVLANPRSGLNDMTTAINALSIFWGQE